jgi:hypothetical protein
MVFISNIEEGREMVEEGKPKGWREELWWHAHFDRESSEAG